MSHPRDYPDLRNAHPHDILGWAVETYQDKLVVVTSFQPTGIVTLHMLQKIAPDLQVVTLDTGLLFPETYALINKLEAQFKLNLWRVKPELSLKEQAAQYGEELCKTAPDECCKLRKVVPLQKVLTNYRAWITGLRRDQSPQRAKVQAVAWDEHYQIMKISPFYNWTEKMIWEYINTYQLPTNDLHKNNYPSIGCKPCTLPIPPENKNLRAGRWARHDKIECGIHLGLRSHHL